LMIEESWSIDAPVNTLVSVLNASTPTCSPVEGAGLELAFAPGRGTNRTSPTRDPVVGACSRPRTSSRRRSRTRAREGARGADPVACCGPRMRRVRADPDVGGRPRRPHRHRDGEGTTEAQVSKRATGPTDSRSTCSGDPWFTAPRSPSPHGGGAGHGAELGTNTTTRSASSTPGSSSTHRHDSTPEPGVVKVGTALGRGLDHGRRRPTTVLRDADGAPGRGCDAFGRGSCSGFRRGPTRCFFGDGGAGRGLVFGRSGTERG
jgi:hypothetical protein